MQIAPALLALAALALQDLPTGKMKAVRIHAYGKTDALAVEDVPLPEPKSGEVLVRVHAAGVNPLDLKTSAGLLGKDKKRLPLVPGYEIAGTVSRCGPDVKGYEVGDAVYGMLDPARMGGWAEFAAVPLGELARRPASLSFEKAAAVPVPALTAWQALVELAEVQQGQTVLVHGGGDHVAFYALQFARLRGARLIATASGGPELSCMRKVYQVETVIDRDTQKFEELAKDVDIVLDSLGGEMQSRSYKCLKKGGFLVSLAQAPDPGRLKALGLRGALVQPRPDPKALDEISKLVEAEKLILPASVPTALRFVERSPPEHWAEFPAKPVLKLIP